MRELNLSQYFRFALQFMALAFGFRFGFTFQTVTIWIFVSLQFYCTLNTMQKGDTVKANRNSVRPYRKFTFEPCACNHLSIQHKIHHSNDYNLPQVSFIELQVVDYFARLKNSLSFLKSGKSFFCLEPAKIPCFFCSSKYFTPAFIPFCG